ncbi:hypothetical protein FEDK69T_01830 [Flavobacterium enshiense DK69]|uniref:Uncharacterized protein n=1 Tax=Flavobacterium enshiense DK69 TaxID=1107311 RepID=V6SEU9_9FLAO|nr:hypothetical protein FEDK69T_01830 [Flavobacterium enshiense DK69]KGO96893.1 hypothetical protein Q767_04140 [Flavobacterium enshiense DK69]
MLSDKFNYFSDIKQWDDKIIISLLIIILFDTVFFMNYSYLKMFFYDIFPIKLIENNDCFF